MDVRRARVVSPHPQERFRVWGLGFRVRVLPNTESLLVLTHANAHARPCQKQPLGTSRFPSGPLIIRAPFFLIFGLNKGTQNERGKRVLLGNRGLINRGPRAYITRQPLAPDRFPTALQHHPSLSQGFVARAEGSEFRVRV